MNNWRLDSSFTVRESTWVLIAILPLWGAGQIGASNSFETVQMILAPVAEWARLIFALSAIVSVALFVAPLLKRILKLQFILESLIASLLAVMLPVV